MRLNSLNICSRRCFNLQDLLLLSIFEIFEYNHETFQKQTQHYWIIYQNLRSVLANFTIFGKVFVFYFPKVPFWYNVYNTTNPSRNAFKRSCVWFCSRVQFEHVLFLLTLQPQIAIKQHPKRYGAQLLSIKTVFVHSNLDKIYLN